MATMSMPSPECRAFDPEAISAMSRALEEACDALDINLTDAHGREVIAIRVIDLACSGVADARAIRDRVLLEAKSVA